MKPIGLSYHIKLSMQLPVVFLLSWACANKPTSDTSNNIQVARLYSDTDIAIPHNPATVYDISLKV